MIEFKYDTQLLIEGNGLDKKEVTRYFDEKIEGRLPDCCTNWKSHENSFPYK